MSSERGSGREPTIEDNLSSGCTGLMKAGFGLRFEGVFLVFGIEVINCLGSQRVNTNFREMKFFLGHSADGQCSQIVSKGFFLLIGCRPIQ